MSSRASTTRPRLSVAMVVRDAESCLAATLENVRSIADEIVVADTGSTDDTMAIARRDADCVIKHAWSDDFSAARNALWPHLSGDWVLWLDADEKFSADDAQQLRAFIDRQASPSVCYMMLVTIPAGPGAASGEQAARIRLVPNVAALRYQGRVRETLRPAIANAGFKIEGLPWKIERSSRQHDRQTKLLRAQRDRRLAELEIREHGQQPSSLLALGEAVSVLGDEASGRACFRRAAELSESGATDLREAYYGLLTSYDNDPSGRDEQIKVCLEALERFPLDGQLLCAMGGYLQAQDRLDLAARSYDTALQYGQIDPEIWHISDIYAVAAICLNYVRQLQNRDELALKALELAIERDPQSLRVRRHLIDLHIKHSRRKEALEEIDRLPSDTPHREALRGAVRGACLAAKQHWAPAIAYLQTAYTAGCRDLVCLRWLSTALLCSGEPQSALPILRQWQAAEPRSVEANKYLEAICGPAQTVCHERTEDSQLRIDPPQPAAGPAPYSHTAAQASSAAQPAR